MIRLLWSKEEAGRRYSLYCNAGKRQKLRSRFNYKNEVRDGSVFEESIRCFV